MRRRLMTATATVLAIGLTAACGGGCRRERGARRATGPIKIWLSNNPEEIAWGKAMVKEWNADHPDEKVTAQEIPAGKTSEEVIGAAITAGNAPMPGVQHRPAAVPQFQKQGGLVAARQLHGRHRLHRGALRRRRRPVQVARREVLPDPLEVEPGDDLLQQGHVQEGRHRPENPPLATYDEFLATSKKIVDSKAAQAAIWPAPSSEFFQSWFDFYPLYAAESGGKQLIEDGKATFNDEAGKEVCDFWAQMYTDGSRRRRSTTVTPSPTRRPRWRSSARGRSPSTATRSTGASSRCRPRTAWTRARSTPSPTPRTSALYSACKNQETAWDVLKFATSEEQDGKLLETTGQMPIRPDLAATYPDYFKTNPDYKLFADQASRTVEVPNVPNSVEIWQEFRDDYSSAVIFGKRRSTSASRMRRTRPTSSPASRDRRLVADGDGQARSRVLGRQPLGILFAAPYAVFLVAVFAYPLGLAVWISFHDYFFAAPGRRWTGRSSGFENYRTVLSDPDVGGRSSTWPSSW